MNCFSNYLKNRIHLAGRIVTSVLFFTLIVGCNQTQGLSLRQTKKSLKNLDAKLDTIVDGSFVSGKFSYGQGDYERTIVVKDRKRRYELHVPVGYTANRKWPVVINYHGGGGRAAAARLQSGMDQHADSAGYIALYPDGTGIFNKRLLTWNAGSCCGYAMNKKVDDVAFTSAMLDDLATLFPIDSDRVYATGLSNGALMAYRLACDLPDRIAAIAPISGTMTMNQCNPSRSVPIIHFHGSEDRCVPYVGGVGKKSVSKTYFPSVNKTLKEWNTINKNQLKPIKKEQKDHALVETYGGNSKESEIVLVTLQGMGHTWPGGTRIVPENIVGGISKTISANDMMWDFFQRHPLKKGSRK